jgi:hypothetical protein
MAADEDATADVVPVSVAQQFEAQVAALPADVRHSACTLIALGRESARRFDEGHDPAGSRLRLVLTDLHKLTERWERLTIPPPVVTPEPEVSQLDQLRAKRAQQMGWPAG